MFDDYLKDVFKDAKGGRATEPTYYPHLKKLLETAASFFCKTKVKVDILPKRVEGGCPDIVVWDGEQHVFGYVECKDVGADLTPSRMSKTNKDQFKRYLETFPNLIYTNFTEFRLYRDHNAKPLLTGSLCDPPEDLGFKAPTGVDADDNTKELLERFFDFSLAKKYTAKTLAQELAKRTRFLKDEVAFEQYAEAAGAAKKNISKFFNAFRGTLIRSLKAEDFADLFSQTITFGLFAARYRTEGEFNRKLAYDSIPPTIGVLHDLFEYISRGKLPPLINQVVNDIAEVLAVADVHKILDDYYKEGKGKKDPIFYFYETFLREYNPKEKEQRGVFFTPEPVVGYIVRSVHKLIQSRFKKPEGLGYRSASNPKRSVMLLDPAGGTLTFLAEATTVALEEHVSLNGEGDKKGFIRNHILQNFYAFELIMAPYVLGHLKMSFLLDELGYELGDEERFKFYLTNTLTLDQDDVDEQMQIWEDILPSFVAEADAASEVKKETPILVIIGNPPYSGHSANPSDELNEKGKPVGRMLLDIRKSENGGFELYEPQKKTATSRRVPKKTFIGRLIEEYKIDGGNWLDEKNPKWLQDDYVKFIRFAHWKIDQKGEGILGFITNHAYIDNGTFRGMRQSLLTSFDDLYILNLHGSILNKEVCPDGTKDEGVFDIQPGTCIGLFVKTKEGHEGGVWFHELWGSREKKYGWLDQNDVETTPWKKVNPETPDCYFRKVPYYRKYQKYWSVGEIFPLHNVGIVTGKDDLALCWSAEEMLERLSALSALSTEQAKQQYDLSASTVLAVQKDIEDPDASRVVPIMYRPFDIRHTYYTGKSSGIHERPRPDTMPHLLAGDNIALISAKTNRSPSMNHFFVSTTIVETKCGESTVQSYTFPLYSYIVFKASQDSAQTSVFDEVSGFEKRSNVNSGLLGSLEKEYGRRPSPEEILGYVYGIMYSNEYRKKYHVILQLKFPHIPFTKDSSLFADISTFGREIIALHTMTSKALDKPSVKFRGAGDNSIEKIDYQDSESRVYINQQQYFDGVTSDVWKYQIGGYTVLQNWLSERKRRGHLDSDLDEPKTFCRIATALAKTVEIQKEMDTLYTEVEKAVIPPPGTAQTAS